MTETTNSQAFIETLEQLEELLDNCDADIDYDTISDTARSSSTTRVPMANYG